jgi:protein-tyrosine phosphatase
MGLYDLHTHLLPSIDDGYVTVETFKKMLGVYRESGFTAIAFTPHIYNPYVTTRIEELRSTFEWAQQIADEMGLSVYLGSELYIGSQDTLKYLPIADRYALVEFALSLPPPAMVEKLKGIIEQGRVVIIAHVERYRWLRPHDPMVQTLVELGCLLQTNVEAVENGDARPYLEAGLVDLIATDNHGDETLPLRLAQALYEWPEVQKRMERLL